MLSRDPQISVAFFLFESKDLMICPSREERTFLIIASELVSLSSGQFIILVETESRIT